MRGDINTPYTSYHLLSTLHKHNILHLNILHCCNIFIYKNVKFEWSELEDMLENIGCINLVIGYLNVDSINCYEVCGKHF